MAQPWPGKGMVVPVLVVAAGCLCAQAPLNQTRQLEYEEFDIRAAFLLSFAKFTEWPEGNEPDGEALVIGILGDSPLVPSLENLARAKGRKVTILRFKGPSEVRDCHILYFPASAEQHLSALKAKLAIQAILTVGESPGFLGLGGTLQVLIEDGRLRFALNREALDQAHLRVAAQVQRLAKQVLHQPRSLP